MQDITQTLIYDPLSSQRGLAATAVTVAHDRVTRRRLENLKLQM